MINDYCVTINLQKLGETSFQGRVFDTNRYWLNISTGTKI